MRRHHSVLALAVGLFLAGAAPTARAAPPGAPEKPPRGLPQRALEEFQKREVVKMLSAIANGSRMGPGEGWFGPGKGRYDWKWLAARLDADRDGRVSEKEFKGPAGLFRRLDRDRSGEIKADDLDWSESSPFVRLSGMAKSWTARVDGNSNGRISAAEWEAFFKRAARGKDHLTPDDLRDALLVQPPPPKNAPREGGPTPAILLAGLASGELGSFFEGPGIGDVAPNFTLPTHDGKRTISLRDYRGKKPVVLIFGSFT